ncbi:hypothetical protein D3C73_1415980 [compost metagenome]
MYKGAQGWQPVQVILVVGDVVAVLLQQFDVQLLFVDAGHAQPRRQGLLVVDGPGDGCGPVQIGIADRLCQLLERGDLLRRCQCLRANVFAACQKTLNGRLRQLVQDIAFNQPQ